MTSDWPRWIFASIAKYFDDNKGSYTLYVEGDTRTTHELQDWAELRVDGPEIQEVSKNVWRIQVEVNILLTVVNDRTDAYKTQRIVGYFQNLMDQITIYKYGDNDTFFGCLNLRNDIRESVAVTHFGKLTTADAMQATVEGHYHMLISE